MLMPGRGGNACARDRLTLVQVLQRKRMAQGSSSGNS